MRFTFTPEQEQFRNDVRAFLDETLTPAFWQHHRQHRLPGWSPEFSRATAERGWLATSWPVEYGGLGLGAIEQSIYMEEMAHAGAPQEHHRRAIQQVGPSIMLFGTPEQKADYLKDRQRGDQLRHGAIRTQCGLGPRERGNDGEARRR